MCPIKIEGYIADLHRLKYEFTFSNLREPP